MIIWPKNPCEFFFVQAYFTIDVLYTYYSTYVLPQPYKLHEFIKNTVNFKMKFVI